MPDCFQRIPRRVQISENGGQILTIAVDGQGIHAIVRNGTRVSYVIYNISSGRAEQDNPFPSDTAAFMGLMPQHISLACPGEVCIFDLNKFLLWYCYTRLTKIVFLSLHQFCSYFQCMETVLLLRDGNSTLYPLVKDCADAIRDPLPLDLPPVRCIGTGMVALTGTTQNQKNQVAVAVLALEQQQLMPKILRCDVEGTRQVLIQLEADSSKFEILHTF